MKTFYKLVSIEKEEGIDWRITIRESYEVPFWLFWKKAPEPRLRTFVGACYSWHEEPSYGQISVMSYLAELLYEWSRKEKMRLRYA